MPDSYLSTTAFAEIFSITADRVVDMIRRGELRAIDVSTGRGKRPTWRISQAERERFEQARSSTPPPPEPKRRRKQAAEVIEFY
jgi:hypothetical protein